MFVFRGLLLQTSSPHVFLRGKATIEAPTFGRLFLDSGLPASIGVTSSLSLSSLVLFPYSFGFWLPLVSHFPGIFSDIF